MKNYVITAGIVLSGKKILLVKHNTEFGSEPFWTIPGGTAEKGEDIIQNLFREVKEETGLSCTSLADLGYIVQHMNYKRNWQSVVLTGVIRNFKGTINTTHTDEDVLEVRFFSFSEAVQHLQQSPFRIISEPLITYLRGKPRQFWLYHEHNKIGEVELILSI